MSSFKTSLSVYSLKSWIFQYSLDVFQITYWTKIKLFMDKLEYSNKNLPLLTFYLIFV